jgi:RNA polymerase sigma-70 factor (ECF subfamily)
LGLDIREADLDGALQSAVAAWPSVHVDRTAFRDHLRQYAAQSGGTLVPHVADLYLAFACGQGVSPAIAILEQIVTQEAQYAIAHLRRPAGFADEVGQRLLEKLLVGANRRAAKIRAYSGKGPLRAWVRSAAMRTALNMVEEEAHVAAREAHAPADIRLEDPEVEHLRRQYGKPLKVAIEAALKGLPPDERSVLRYYFVQGLTTERIATLRGTHKSTVSRLLTRMRRTLLEQVEISFRQEFKGTPSELRSMLRDVRSQIPLSIERALATASSPSRR